MLDILAAFMYWIASALPKTAAGIKPRLWVDSIWRFRISSWCDADFSFRREDKYRTLCALVSTRKVRHPCLQHLFFYRLTAL
jgi:hypothetical protein